jgi:plastocyanin
VRRAGAIALAVAALSLLIPASASAAERIVAIPQSQYATQNVAIDQGEPLSFLNLDVLSHDVTARGKGANGQPLFSTPLIGTGQEVPVERTDTLGPGEYAFYCTIHPNMEGTLTVGGGGSGGGGGGSSGLSVRILDSKLSEVRKEGALSVEVTHERSATITLSATTKSGGDRVALGRTKQDFEGSASHPVEIRLSRGGKKALRGEDSVKVAVSARAGDQGSAKDRATLK